MSRPPLRSDSPPPRYSLIALAAILIAGGAMIPALAHPPGAGGHGAAAPAIDSDGPRHVSEQTVRFLGLQTAEVDFGAVETIVRLPGIVRSMPERTFVVTSGIAGTLARLDARLYQRVRRGQTLGEVHSTDLARMITDLHKAEIEHEHTGVEIAQTTSNITQLKNQLTSTEAQAASLEAEYARALGGGDAISPAVLSNRKTSATQSRAQVDTLKVSLSTAERTLTALGRIQTTNLKTIDTMRDAVEMIRGRATPDGGLEPPSPSGPDGRFPLRAPADGVIVQREGLAGQGIEPGKPIFTIVDDSQMLIEAELPESMIAAFAADLAAPGAAGGGEVRIRRSAPATGSADEPIATGRVIGISPTVDPVRRTARLLVSAPNTIPAPAGDDAAPSANPSAPAKVAVPATLQDGLFVSLAISRTKQAPSGTSRTVSIPASAILNDGPLQFVFVKEKDAFLKRTVLTGARDDRAVEIADGLVPGDVVVTQGAYLLSQMRPTPPTAATP